jgi:acetyl-CoA acetyltransferase
MNFQTPESSQANLNQKLSSLSKQKLKKSECIGSIGWGVEDAEFRQTFRHQIHCKNVKDQPFKSEAEQENHRLFMFTTGLFASHVDNMYKITYEDLERLSVRKQKEVIFARATEHKR